MPSNTFLNFIYQLPPPPPPPPPPEDPPPPEPEELGEAEAELEESTRLVFKELEKATTLKALVPEYHSGGSLIIPSKALAHLLTLPKTIA